MLGFYGLPEVVFVSLFSHFVVVWALGCLAIELIVPCVTTISPCISPIINLACPRQQLSVLQGKLKQDLSASHWALCFNRVEVMLQNGSHQNQT